MVVFRDDSEWDSKYSQNICSCPNLILDCVLVCFTEYYRVQTRPQPMKLTARAPLSRAAGLTSFSSSREMSGMRSAGMMRARSPVQLMHRPRKSPDMEEVRPTRLEITTSNNYRVSSLYPSMNVGCTFQERMWSYILSVTIIISWSKFWDDPLLS